MEYKIKHDIRISYPAVHCVTRYIMLRDLSGIGLK